MSSKRLRFQHLALALTAVLLFIAAGPLRVWFAHGDELGSRSLQLSDSTVSDSSNYVLSFDGQSGATVGSVRAQFCSNNPLIGQPCTAPSGFDISHASLTAQSGMNDVTIDTTNTTANVLVLQRTPSAAPVNNTIYTLSGVVNPDTEGSYFVRLETFASTDASGSHIDYGGLAFSIGPQVNISTYVPPYLLLCTGITIQPYDCSTASGDYIDYGELSAGQTSTGHTHILVATNADGYTLRVAGTPPTSGNNVIPALVAPDVSRAGVSQFGLNLRANTAPAAGVDVQGNGSGAVSNGYDTPNFYKFGAGDVVASANAADDYRLYTATYILNISKTQAPGVYVNSISYIGLANF